MYWDDGLFQMNIMTPSQFYGDRSHPQLAGVRKLLVALLADAINCLQGTPQYMGALAERHPHNIGRLRREARLWFEAKHDRYAFSFESVCDVLGYDADALREALFARLAAIDVPRQSPALCERSLHMSTQRSRNQGQRL
jgi:hypothetical protein